MTVILGDCVEAMAAMAAGSVDAVVTDPPYGLEFMGKEWDRLGDIGKASHAGPRPHDPESVFSRQRIAYSASANVKCARCDRWKWDHAGRKCECGPDAVWPNVRAVEGQRMQAWHEAWAREALRVLKPGGHLLAFGGTRTYHRLATAIEDAGFEIRDCLAWLYGSGFPKSLDVSKAIDKAAGAEGGYGAPKSAAHAGWIERGAMRGQDGHDGYQRPWMADANAVDRNAREYLPATPEAAAWQGWGTALKPAFEPVVVARKPLAGTVAGNVQAHGTGALNIDGCRITVDPHDPVRDAVWTSRPSAFREGGTGFLHGSTEDGDRRSAAPPEAGRWPANVVLDPEAAAILDAQSGERPGGNYPEQRGAAQATGFGEGRPTPGGARSMDDTGGASRFFYCAKAGSRERNAGFDDFEKRQAQKWNDGGIKAARADTARPVANVHPTVKPIELMRWLVRLVTPSGGTVLDPFTGSGTTGIAAALERFTFTGIERDPDYHRIATARIEWWARHAGEGDTAQILEAAETRDEHAAAGQLDLLGDAA